ncbi:hypothetical protein AEQ67_19090 [Pseudomonas sp. RIT-PI-q]|uniref:TorF family putative porin n=1 Tax=Pseudomonas sp. RIT-PI-q TaxID=1690247 RepID=UPI0006CCC7DA|nr:TorF family putative porin [Pseudomonas sp. RIT-PI-q]KPG96029.1 hypothetical protein AEQ67_19090 [Pseudomonas sp. RIT-PI-q]
MKNSIKISLLGLLAPWTVTNAVEINKDFSVALDAGVYSQYWSRGMSQSQGNPAVQGSATLVHSSGLYAGVWSSSVDFGYDNRTRQEIDWYAGYVWTITDAINLDMAYLKYEYPNENSFNYSEYYAKLSAHGFNVGGYYSGDLGGNQSMLYSFVGYDTTLPGRVGLALRYGLVDYKDPVFIAGDGNTRDHYNEWQITLNKEVFGLNWSVAYVDSNLSSSECYNYTGFDDNCSASFVVGVDKKF